MSQKQTTLPTTEVIVFLAAQHNVPRAGEKKKNKTPPQYNADILFCTAALLPGYKAHAISRPRIQSFAHAED